MYTLYILVIFKYVDIRVVTTLIDSGASFLELYIPVRLQTLEATLGEVVQDIFFDSEEYQEERNHLSRPSQSRVIKVLIY